MVNLGFTSSGTKNEFSAFSDRIGLRYLSYRNSKNSWIISGNLMSILQQETDPIRYFPTARVLYTRTTHPSFSYFVGGGYNFIFGNGLPVPLLGFRWKSSSKTSLRIILPGIAQFTIQHSNSLSGRIILQPIVNLSLAKATDLPEETRNTIVRSRAFKLGFQEQWRGKTGIRMMLEAGLLFKRRLQFTEQEFNKPSDTAVLKIQNGAYIEFLLSIPIGNKKRLENNSDTDLLELDDDDISNGIW